VGTPQYLAPELLRGEGATTASDWWALGVLMFEMLTGDLPFSSPDGTDSSLFAVIKRGMYVWPGSLPQRDLHTVAKAQSKGDTTISSEERPRRRSFIGTEPASILSRDLVACLLRTAVPPPPTKGRAPPADAKLGPVRIGAGRDGAAEIRAHKWFAGFEFEELHAGQHPSPYVPNLRGKDDDSNFGPISWRGQPIVSSPDYDVAKWDALWDECSWSK